MLNELKKELNITTTENGALVRKTTYNSCLDLFALVGSVRNRESKEIITLFEKAYNEDQLTAMKILFYLRDIRGGIGERNTFRVIAKYMADAHTTSMRKNLEFISEFGRWDDLYAFIDTSLQNDALEIIKKQLSKDLESENPSLLAKWMPSENTSSSTTKRNATITRKYLKMSPKTYRKTLTKLRKKIDIVETKLCENNYKDIEYDKLPSGAGLKYKDAFFRHDEERYKQFIEDVSNGKTKINSSTLFPYELVREAQSYICEYWDYNEKIIPYNMKVAMVLGAGACVITGIFPNIVYSLTPFGTDGHPFTVDHVTQYVQLFAAATVAFIMYLEHMKPKEKITLDTDWFYRKPLNIAVEGLSYAFDSARIESGKMLKGAIEQGNIFLHNPRLIGENLFAIKSPEEKNCIEKDDVLQNSVGKLIGTNFILFIVLIVFAIIK